MTISAFLHLLRLILICNSTPDEQKIASFSLMNSIEIVLINSTKDVSLMLNAALQIASKSTFSRRIAYDFFASIESNTLFKITRASYDYLHSKIKYDYYCALCVFACLGMITCQIKLFHLKEYKLCNSNHILRQWKHKLLLLFHFLLKFSCFY